MKIAHYATAERTGASPHRPGGIRFINLLRGEEWTIDNFWFTIAEIDEEFFGPRHRHNFEQVRIMLEGESQFDTGRIQKAGSIGYFSEGTYYQQTGKGHSATLLLQVPGASAAPYMSARQLAEGAEALQEIGEFNDGVFTWFDARGRKRNKDSYEAIWRHIFGREIEYPKPRYEGPILFWPKRFAYLNDPRQPGVAVKRLARFNERGLDLRQVKLEAHARWMIDTSDAASLLFATQGTGRVGREAWLKYSAIHAERNDTLVIEAEEESEFYVLGLPAFDDLPREVRRPETSRSRQAA